MKPLEGLTLSDIEAAQRRIAPTAMRTPLLRSAALDALAGAELYLKAEPLQRTGSFKFRGAMSRMSLLGTAERQAGVVAFSSGNHAQAVACAAEMLGVPATIVMPADAPALKIANTRGYGAEVVLYDRIREDREEIGRRLAQERGLTLVPPFDDYAVMAGQGTIGLEILQDIGDTRLDALLVCCSGGGLTSGIATVFAARSAHTRIYTVEPADFDDTARSLEAGERLSNGPGKKSICDALLLDRPGALTFPILKRLAAGGLTVDEDAVRNAMRLAYLHLKLVVEPGGAVALAAALDPQSGLKGQRLGVILSGGNVDPELYAAMLAASP